MADVVAEINAHVPGFKSSFGGEELKRATATLQGAISNRANTSPASLRGLMDHTDLTVRELAYAARQYATATAGAPTDHEARYHHGLVLQELASKLPPGSEDQIDLLRQACERYAAVVALRPSSHSALYNWGVALSDLARALRPAGGAEATACLHLASQKYAASLRVNPANPQALNNWGLVLQELASEAGEAGGWAERDALVRSAMDKFRAALRLMPDFDRGCYNLGTVFYTFASAQASEGGGGGGGGTATGKDARARAARDLAVRSLLAAAAQYILLAHALQPSREVYRRSLPVVRHMLPLPFLRAGYLTAPLSRDRGGVGERSRRAWFVLDQASLRGATDMEGTLSAAGAGIKSTTRVLPKPPPEEEPLVLALAEVADVRRCAEPSLPEGEAFWVALDGGPSPGVYFVADDADAADAWVDALLLASRLVRTRGPEALLEALAPPTRRAGSLARPPGGGGGGGGGGGH